MADLKVRTTADVVRAFRLAFYEIISRIAGDIVMNETVGFIGLGVMGRPMAKHILSKGYKLVGCNRSPGPVEEIVKAGGTAGEYPADVARQATIVITMVPDTPDVQPGLKGTNGGPSALRRRPAGSDTRG